MGILDDAIREHLELKRQHGADRADVERLEQEAFGPATRPGDPDFDTGTEAAAPAADAADAAPAQAPVAEAPAPAAEPSAPAAEERAPDAEGADAEGEFTDWFAEDETTVAPEAPSAPEPEDAAPEAPPAPEPEAPPPTPAEQARIEHTDLGETADHPAPEQLGPADEAEPVPHEASPSSEQPAAAAQEEEEPPEPPESDIFDFGEEGDDEPESEERPPAAVTPAPTTDHDLPPAPVRRPAEGGDEGEDLLEETPDFLQDAPEGEDLWFEQGPPKDFDFDEDDDD